MPSRRQPRSKTHPYYLLLSAARLSSTNQHAVHATARGEVPGGHPVTPPQAEGAGDVRRHRPNIVPLSLHPPSAAWRRGMMVLLLILLMWATPSLTCRDLGKGGGTQLNDRGCGGVADVGEFLPHLQGQKEVWGVGGCLYSVKQPGLWCCCRHGRLFPHL